MTTTLADILPPHLRRFAHCERCGQGITDAEYVTNALHHPVGNAQHGLIGFYVPPGQPHTEHVITARCCGWEHVVRVEEYDGQKLDVREDVWR